MTSEAPHEVKPPSAILAGDVICQSFIQSSSTLAYACLLIRRGRYDLAAHVLHSLEAKPASRFKDMVFYLQAQIGIETGDFAPAKRRLAPRVHQHPNDMVALSLLESCIYLEWEDWSRRNPAAAVRTMAEERTMVEPSIPEIPAEDSVPAYHTLSVATVPSGNAALSPSDPEPVSLDAILSAMPVVQVVSPSIAAASLMATPVPAAAPTAHPHSPSFVAPEAQAMPTPAAASNGSAAPDSPYASVPAGADADFGIYQTLAADPNTLALCLWNRTQRRLRSTFRKREVEPLVASLPYMLPSGLEDSVRALEGGEIHKICFSFQTITVTSLHAGADNLGLVTGNINQSLLTMVRAENIFLKQGLQGGRGRPASDRRESQALEISSND